MPIVHNNIGQTCIGFGYGDILIAVASREPEGTPDEVVIYPHIGEPQPVGKYNEDEKGKNVGDSRAVRLCFDSLESLDVMIERCQELRLWMTGEKTDQQAAGTAEGAPGEGE